MKIFKLNRIFGIVPEDCFLQDYSSILPTKNGWVVNLFYKGKPSCYSVDLDGNLKKLTDTSIYFTIGYFGSVDFRIFDVEKEHVCLYEFRLNHLEIEGIYNPKEKDLKNPRYTISLINPKDWEKERLSYEGDYADKHPLDQERALLVLSAIDDPKKSFLVIYDKEAKKAMSFESPLNQPLLGACVSKDGLTLLMISKNYAAIIDNPFM